MNLFPIILIGLTGCCAVTITREDGSRVSVVDIGTGRRTIIVDGVHISHSEIADTLRASGGLVDEAAKAAGYGGAR